MSNAAKFERRLLSGDADKSLRFDAMRRHLLALGFEERVHGSHHVFKGLGLVRPLTIQRDGALCKAYQVRQVRNVLVECNLRLPP